MASLRLVIVLLLSLVVLTYSQCTSPTLTQSIQSSWVNDGQTYTLITGELANTGSATLRSVIVQLNGHASISQIWELNHVNSGLYQLPQWRLDYSGIPAQSVHTFGYIIISNTFSSFSISSFSCDNTPTIAPPTTPPTTPPTNPPTNPPTTPPTNPPTTRPTSTPTVPPTNTPTTPPTSTNAVCKVALVIDSYITRNLPSLSNAEVIAKYAKYFSDINLYYTTNFKLEMQLAYVYAEGPTSSFTNEIDGGKLLDAFRFTVGAGGFPDIPTDDSICIYHLISGRQPPGVGGLAWVGSACANDFGNSGFTIDGNANENAELVIRRAIHEIGHNLGGNHPDVYTSNPEYTCSVNDDNANERILKRSASVKRADYQYLSSTAFISDCASESIRASLPSYTCTYNVSTVVYPYTVLCSDINAEGSCYTVRGRREDPSGCYNILPFNDQLSSFQVFAGSTGAKGLRLYENIDCTGTSADFINSYQDNVGDFNDRATAFRFIF